MTLKKKVLIYMLENSLKPTGGPAGYLYNLKLGLELNNIECIHFIKLKDRKSAYRSFYDKLPLSIKKIYRVAARQIGFKRLFTNKQNFAIVNLNEYDIVHFHSTKDMYKARGSLEKYTGKVILTSHTPKPPHLEVIQDALTAFEKKIFFYNMSKFIQIDEYAFTRANYIVFPCVDAEEPYFSNWNRYANIRLQNAKKYRYLLTGTRTCSCKLDRASVLKKYNIPESAFIISYVGRHNATKGYDFLKKIGRIILANNKDIYFLIAGEEVPLIGLRHDRWVEVGWTNDPHSIIAASDVFVLPNKETYFDLVMLEVLSLGKIIVASNTGGNKYFRKIDVGGVFLYDTKEEIIELIEKMKQISEREKKEMGIKNKDAFEKYFANEVFCQNYLKLINSLD